MSCEVQEVRVSDQHLPRRGPMVGVGAGGSATTFLSRQPAQQLCFWLFPTLYFHKRLRGDEDGKGGLKCQARESRPEATGVDAMGTDPRIGA